MRYILTIYLIVGAFATDSLLLSDPGAPQCRTRPTLLFFRLPFIRSYFSRRSAMVQDERSVTDNIPCGRRADGAHFPADARQSPIPWAGAFGIKRVNSINYFYDSIDALDSCLQELVSALSMTCLAMFDWQVCTEVLRDARAAAQRLAAWRP